MHAIEFQTTITNSFVQIPNYEEFANKQVRIIVLDNTQNTTEKIDNVNNVDTLFDKFSIDMNAFNFDRNEANAR